MPKKEFLIDVDIKGKVDATGQIKGNSLATAALLESASDLSVKHGNSVQGAMLGRLLVSNAYTDISKVPTNGAYIKGIVKLGDFTELSSVASTGALKVKTTHGTITIGPANSSLCHFDTDKDSFYFSKEVLFRGNLRAYTNNTQEIGRSSKRFSMIYSVSADFSSHIIVGAPTLNNHAATKKYVDDKTNGFVTNPVTSHLYTSTDGTKDFGAPTKRWRSGYFSQVFAEDPPATDKNLTNKKYVDDAILAKEHIQVSKHTANNIPLGITGAVNELEFHISGYNPDSNNIPLFVMKLHDINGNVIPTHSFAAYGLLIKKSGNTRYDKTELIKGGNSQIMLVPNSLLNDVHKEIPVIVSGSVGSSSNGRLYGNVKTVFYQGTETTVSVLEFLFYGAVTSNVHSIRFDLFQGKTNVRRVIINK